MADWQSLFVGRRARSSTLRSTSRSTSNPVVTVTATAMYQALPCADPKNASTGVPVSASVASTSALVGSVNKLNSPSARRRNFAAFWILGLCNNYGYVVMLSAAYDILSKNFNISESSHMPGPRDCNTLSTGAILLADIIPSLIIKFLSPFFPLWMHVRLGVTVGLNVAGFLLVAFAGELWVALAGVACMSLASGLGEVSLLSYTAFYKDKTVITMWSSGTGGAGVLGSVSYLGLSLILSPRDTLLLMLSMPFAMSLCFWVLMVHPHIDSSEDLNDSKNASVVVKVEDDVPTHFTHASFMDKVRDIPPLLRYIIPLTTVYLFEYFINQGLFEIINYKIDWLEHSVQYKIFQVVYQVGVFISRSSGSYVHIERTWIFALLQGINVIYFTFEAIYSFSSSFWVVVVLVLWEGLLGGGAYVNTFHCISTKIPPEKREFSMAMSAVGDSIGVSAAGFIAIPVHNLICKLPLY